MADTLSYTSKFQKVESQNAFNHSNRSKFSYTYMYKAIIVTIFLVLLPLFPTQAPEFINQTLHARSWELLQLIFVGIAVSYGLFSTKNDDDTDKDHGSKFDNAQTYVSKLLPVSSVFDDETENQTVADENKIQTWNSQYYRGKPLMVVAKERSPISTEEKESTSSGVSQKPLLLPVRSLKQRVPESVEVHDSGGKTDSAISRSRSNSGSKRFSNSSSRKSRNGEVGGINPVNLEEKVDDNVVLRSPIPWRSRSGRIQMKENGDDPPSYSMEEESEINSLESPSFVSSKSNSTSATPKILSPSPSISSPKKHSSLSSKESQAKSSEDLMRKKNSHKFSSPPPPPPPPPTHLRKSVLTKSNSSVLLDGGSSEKQLRRSVRSVPTQEISETELDEPPRRANFGSDFKASRVQSDDVPPVMGKSVRTFRRGEFQTEKSPQQYEATTFPDRSQGYANKSAYENLSPNNALPKKEVVERFIEETSEEHDDYSSETEFEDDDSFEGVSPGNNGNNSNANADDNENCDTGRDVDKKADEFIAKFREQIRLQRIESIRRSTAQRAAGKSVR